MPVENPAAPAPAAPEAPVIQPAAAFAQPPTPAPAQTAPPMAQPPAVPAAPAPTTNIVLTQDEYQAVLKDRTRLAEIDATLARQQLEAREKEFAALAKQGKLEEAMQMLRQQSEENTKILERQANERLETARRDAQQKVDAAAQETARIENERRATQVRAEQFALDNAISQAMSPHVLVAGGAEQVVALVRPHMQVEAHGESFAVRSTSGLSAADFVTGFLNANPHFVAARNPGGGVQTPGQPTQNAPGAPAQTPPAQNDPMPGAPKNMGYDFIRQYKATMAERGTSPDPRFDTTRSFGLTGTG